MDGRSMANVYVGCRLPQHLVEKLDRVAKAEGKNRTETLIAMLEMVEEEEEPKPVKKALVRRLGRLNTVYPEKAPKLKEQPAWGPGSVFGRK
jgi:metal-responsive CopG/Arc/MetJ family transcriptional regulator